MRRAVWLGALLGSAILVAGCSGASSSPGQSTAGGDEPATLTVGVLPINNLAPLYVAIDQGWFEEVGLTIEPEVYPGGSQVVAALTSGDLDVGWSASTGTIIAASRGLPIKVVAPGVICPTSATEDSGQPVVVAADSPIEDVEDLAGKTIAVNTRGNILDITISATLDAHGVDPASVSFVEIPFPDMPAALENGQVDAVAAAEPFFTQLEASGARVIFDAFSEACAGLPGGHYVSTTEFAEKNRSALDRFEEVIARANIYANENPDAAREAIGTYTQIPKDLIEVIKLAPWTDDIDPEGLEKMVELTREYGPGGLPELDVSKILLD